MYDELLVIEGPVRQWGSGDYQCYSYKIKKGSPHLCIQRIFDLFSPPDSPLEAVMDFPGEIGMYIPSDYVHVFSFDEFKAEFNNFKFRGCGMGCDSVSFRGFGCYGSKLSCTVSCWYKEIIVAAPDIAASDFFVRSIEEFCSGVVCQSGCIR